jgi:hypothetical protein
VASAESPVPPLPGTAPPDVTVPPVVEAVQPLVETVPPDDVVSGLPVVGQLLPPGSSKTKPAPLLSLP